MEIKSIITEDSIEIYWTKQEGIREYDIICSNGVTVHSSSTHALFENLDASKEYSFSITSADGTIKKDISFSTTVKRKRIDVTKAPYNCVGDGVTMNTVGLQKAIDDCGEGECVYVPAGVFMTAALDLHSDMELFIDKDGELRGTADPKDYLPKIWSRYEGTEMECYRSFLNMGKLDRNAGYTTKNIMIRGGGTICSGGAELAKAITRTERERLADEIAALGDKLKEYEHKDTIPGRMRGRLINISNCQDVTITGVTLKNGASWNVHFIYSDNIRTSNCTFVSEGIWNGDGWDPDSSTNCAIFGCKFFTGDDSVAVKSGKNPEGNVVNKPTKNIDIFDCACAYGHGLCMGSEMSGGVENVHIWDCDMGNSMSGIEIKATNKRGGYVKGVVVDSTIVSHIMFHSVPYNNDGIAAEHPPIFEDCHFKNLEIWGELYNHERERIQCDAIELIGFEEKGYDLKNVTFDNIKIGKPGAEGRTHKISLGLASSVSLTNITVM